MKDSVGVVALIPTFMENQDELTCLLLQNLIQNLDGSPEDMEQWFCRNLIFSLIVMSCRE